MFSIYKKYIKWKLISLIQAKLVVYLQQKYNYADRQKMWEVKEHDEKGCISKENFYLHKKEQITFSYEQYKKHMYIYDAVVDILKMVEEEL